MMLTLIMSFRNLKNTFTLITEKVKNNECYTKEWKNFCVIAKNLEKNPPVQLQAIHNILNRLKKKMNKKKNFYTRSWVWFRNDSNLSGSTWLYKNSWN